MLNREHLESLCQIGYTQDKISKEIGISREMVNYYMSKYGLSTGRQAPNRKKWDEIERTKLYEMVSSGMTNRSISKAIGRTVDMVAKYLTMYGLQREEYIPHPNLKEDFFEYIDTKEKAYWLGFLYADGFVRKGNGAIVLDLSDKDAEWVYKFCDVIGVDYSRIRLRTHKQGYKSISVIVQSRTFTEHIVRHGCVNAKSKIIRLPDLSSDELDMAFLMGYYDGDGTAEGTEICSGSEGFLLDVVKRYNLRFTPKRGKTVSSLNLGVDLKRRLISNFPDGMPRKHSMYRVSKKRKMRGTEPIQYPRKFNVEKEELELLISEYTYVEIGKKFNVSDNSVKKRAIVLGIELKNRKKGPRKKMTPCV